MNLKDQFQTNLNTLSGTVPCTVSAAEEKKRVLCELVEVTPLAYSFERFALETETLKSASMDQLERISEDLASRLTYLLEPIGPIERDHEQCVVQMRSNPPQQDDDGRSYYELLVRRGGQLALRRYRKELGQVRKTIPALVTREVLLRLVDDFDAVA